MKSITVNQAIRIGFLRIILPCILVMLLGIFAWVAAFALQMWILGIVSLVFSFILMFFVWGILSPRWELWAYARVDDIDELKRKAIQRGYIYQEDSNLNKFRILSRADRIKLIQLRTRSPREIRRKVPEDDGTLPFETKVYYSLGYRIMIALISGGLIMGGLFSWFYFSSIYCALFITIIGVFFLMFNIKHKKFSCQIVLNDDGYQVKGDVFKNWNGITNAELEFAYRGGFLHFYDADGTLRDSLSIPRDYQYYPYDIEDMARLYCYRSWTRASV